MNEAVIHPEHFSPELQGEVQMALRWAEKLGFWIPEPVTAPWLDRQEWLIQRLTGLGSSDVWKLFSEDPEDLQDLYWSKVNPPEDEDRTTLPWDIERGLWGEPKAAELYERLTGRKTISIPLVRHKDKPWFLTDVDRLILPGTGTGDYYTEVPRILEIKCPRYHVMKKYRDHGLPDHIIWQKVHHSFVTGIPHWSFCAFNTEMGLLLQWDDEAPADMMLMIEQEGTVFWEEHVEKASPPSVTKTKLPQSKGVEVKGVKGEAIIHEEKEWLEAAKLFREAVPVLKDAEALEEDARGALRKLCGDAHGAHMGGGVRCTVSERPGSVKWRDTVDAIADQWPISSKRLKQALLTGYLRGPEGQQLESGEIQELMNQLALDPYSFKVTGKPSISFTPRLTREED